jgi:hypothetical protein
MVNKVPSWVAETYHDNIVAKLNEDIEKLRGEINMRALSSSEEVTGIYHILSNTEFEGTNYIVAKRGGQVRLIRIPTKMIIFQVSDHSSRILEIQESGGFKVPVCRVPHRDSELAEIDACKEVASTNGPHRMLS